MLALTTAISALALAASNVFGAPTAEHLLVARQGYTDECQKTYSVQSGDTCNRIIDKFNATFTLAQFYSWNPQVADGCYNLYPGEIVCVGLADTPTSPPACPVPVQPGLVSNCDVCYKAQPGDNCYVVTQKEGVSLDDFYLWNPSLYANCTNLIEGYNYCVGVAS